jgi:vancomycin resistance protein VanW
MSNLIYWMALHTPLTVTERHRHSYDVFPDSNRTQPFGSGATCAYNYLDLQIRNGTDAPWQLLVAVGEENLTGQWRSTEPCPFRYEVYERDARIESNVWGGFVRHNAIWRRAFDGDGNLVRDEFIAENNALMMYQPYLEAGDTKITRETIS